MKQLLQSFSDGTTEVCEIPVPRCGKGHILIRSSCSLISAGTERSLVSFGRSNYLSKARQQPDKVRDVLNKIKTIAGNSRRQVQQTEIKLSQTDINRIQMHVTKYFNLSYSATEVKIIIPLKISANTDGTIKSARILDISSYEKDKFYRAAADAARRAVLDSSPLPLPKGKEKKFQNFIFDFNTSFINDY